MRMSLLLVMAVSGCATTTSKLDLPPLETVPKVDLQRYAGTWYEVAAFPQRFQKGCTGTQATYSLRDDGNIDVLNRCNLESLDGKEKVATGRARVVDTQTNARLEVSFFGPFWGEYWVIQLDPEYRYAVVGHPSRDFLWILSRTPEVDDTLYASILARLKEVGYPLDRLVKTVQPSGRAR